MYCSQAVNPSMEKNYTSFQKRQKQNLRARPVQKETYEEKKNL